MRLSPRRSLGGWIQRIELERRAGVGLRAPFTSRVRASTLPQAGGLRSEGLKRSDCCAREWPRWRLFASGPPRQPPVQRLPSAKIVRLDRTPGLPLRIGCSLENRGRLRPAFALPPRCRSDTDSPGAPAARQTRPRPTPAHRLVVAARAPRIFSPGKNSSQHHRPDIDRASMSRPKHQHTVRPVSTASRAGFCSEKPLNTPAANPRSATIKAPPLRHPIQPEFEPYIL